LSHISCQESITDHSLPGFGAKRQKLAALHDQFVQYQIKRIDRVLAVFATIMKKNDSAGL